ncbi:MAG: hypothetical protein LUE27_07675, partial [Clostridia bacterium]|nr:hypothetical protein [Clostridia bacterium]
MTDNTEEAEVKTSPAAEVSAEANPAADAAKAGTAAKPGKKHKKHSKAYKAVSKFFGFKKRGTNIKTEIFAGILLFFELAFFIYVNAFMLTDTFEGVSSFNLLPVHSLYFIMAMVSCVTTIAVGVLCNAPFAQAGSLGMTMLIVSITGQYAGLTYANIMAISLVANLVYLVVMVIPPARNFVFNAVPEQVRKALPAAMGVFLIVYVLVQMNILSLTSYDFSSVFSNVQDTGGAQIGFFGLTFLTLSVDELTADSFFYVMPIICAFLGFIILLVLKRFHVKHATIISFAGTFVLYIIIYYFVRLSPIGLTDYKLFSFVMPSYGDKMYYSASIDSMMMVANNSYIWAAFKQGFDFTAYTEAGGTGVAGIFIVTALTFLILGVSETGAAVNACGYITGSLDENGHAMYICQPKYKKA